MIRKCKKGDAEPGKPWCLYTRDGSRLLGRHKNKHDAHVQEGVIQKAKKARGAVVAALDYVAQALERRGAVDLSLAADSMSEVLLQDQEEELKNLGFDTIMQRSREAAEEVYYRRIDPIPDELEGLY